MYVCCRLLKRETIEHICDNGQRLATRGADLARDPLAGFRSPSQHCHTCSCCRQLLCHYASKYAGSSGYERHTVLQGEQLGEILCFHSDALSLSIVVQMEHTM